MSSFVCWIEGVGLWVSVLLTFGGGGLLLIAIGILILGGIGKGIDRSVKFLKVERGARFIGNGLAWMFALAVLAAITFASKEAVCRQGFVKSYKAAVHKLFDDDASTSRGEMRR